MAFSTQREDDEVLSEINVTPLVDVMLVLVVVFLVTAPLLTNTIRVNLPQTDKTAPTRPDPQKKSVNLSIASGGKVYVDRQEIDLGRIEPELRALRAAHPELVVHLNADRDIQYGLLARAMSAVDRAGISRLSLLTVGDESPSPTGTP